MAAFGIWESACSILAAGRPREFREPQGCVPGPLRWPDEAASDEFEGGSSEATGSPGVNIFTGRVRSFLGRRWMAAPV